jgi:hypothetical protein
MSAFTILNHHPLKIGTFKSILNLVAAHHRIGLDVLMNKLNL